METLLMIVGLHAVLLGFACFVAGLGLLAAPRESEIQAERRAYEIEHDKSWWHGFVFAVGQAASVRRRSLASAVSHWPDRPEARKFMYAAAALIVIAALIGHHFGVFSS